MKNTLYILIAAAIIGALWYFSKKKTATGKDPEKTATPGPVQVIEKEVIKYVTLRELKKTRPASAAVISGTANNMN